MNSFILADTGGVTGSTIASCSVDEMTVSSGDSNQFLFGFGNWIFKTFLFFFFLKNNMRKEGRKKETTQKKKKVL
jgi:hypothetical protein